MRAILKAAGTTAVFVTHDQNEAFAMADRIAVMNDGRIQQIDAAYNLYHRPANRFVADFIGQGVLVDATVLAPRRLRTEIAEVDCREPIRLADSGAPCPPGARVTCCCGPTTSSTTTPARSRRWFGPRPSAAPRSSTRSQLHSGATVLALVPSHHNHAIDEPIGIRLELDHVIAFAPLPRRHGSRTVAAA